MNGQARRKAAIIVATTKDAFKAFFQISKGDDPKDVTKKISIVGVRRFFYAMADYWTILLCASLVSTMKYWGWPFWQIAIAIWAVDFAFAMFFMVLSEKSGHDITLGESFRRAADVIHSSNQMIGILTFVGLNVKAVIWDGPEQVVIFFKKEIGGMGRMSAILVVLTLVQGIFWAWVYGLGYESVTEIIKHFFTEVM